MIRKLLLSLMCVFMFMGYAYANLEDFSSPTQSYIQVRGLNDDGVVVGYHSGGSGFVYENGQMTLYSNPTYGSYFFNDINNNRLVVCYAGGNPCVFDLSTETITYLDKYTNTNEYYVIGISDSNVIVGRYRNIGQNDDIPIIYHENEKITVEGYSGYPKGKIVNINNNNKAVVCYTNTSGEVIYRTIQITTNPLSYTILDTFTMQSKIPISVESIGINEITDNDEAIGTLTENGINKVYKHNLNTDEFEILFDDIDFSGSLMGANGNGNQIAMRYSIPNYTGFIWTPDYNVSINDVGVNEAESSSTFTVSLDKVLTDGTIEISYSVSNGTATVSEDFEDISGTLVFSVNEQHKTIEVPIINDTENELDETFNVNITSINGNAIIIDSQGVGTIFDDDDVPYYTLTVSSPGQGNGGYTDQDGTTSLAENTEVTITATAEMGYTFTEWIVDGNSVGTDNPLIITLTADTQVTALFDLTPINVIIEAEPFFLYIDKHKKDILKLKIDENLNLPVEANLEFEYQIVIKGKGKNGGDLIVKGDFIPEMKNNKVLQNNP